MSRLNFSLPGRAFNYFIAAIIITLLPPSHSHQFELHFLPQMQHHCAGSITASKPIPDGRSGGLIPSGAIALRYPNIRPCPSNQALPIAVYEFSLPADCGAQSMDPNPDSYHHGHHAIPFVCLPASCGACYFKSDSGYILLWPSCQYINSNHYGYHAKSFIQSSCHLVLVAITLLLL